MPVVGKRFNFGRGYAALQVGTNIVGFGWWAVIHITADVEVEGFGFQLCMPIPAVCRETQIC